MAQVPLPSAAELADFAEVCLNLAEEPLEEFEWDELLEALRAFCEHPVRVFACRVCDLVVARDAQNQEEE